MIAEEMFKAWPGAVVTLKAKRGGETMERPAAFVFARPDGFAWLEPGYADTWPAPQPTWHEVKATLVVKNSGLIMFDGPEWSGDIEEFFGQTSGKALEWFETWLGQQGRTYLEERARLLDDGIVPTIG